MSANPRSRPPAPSSPLREMPETKVDLSRMRHELRTPINHILGYCELLLEEDRLPETHRADLRRIHAGGRELQVLIGRYFDEEQFFQQRDLHQLYHELRTPVNHIIGYSDLLIEMADDAVSQAAVVELTRIRDAASAWLGLMEAYLVDPIVPASPGGRVQTPQAIALNLGFSFKVPEPRSARGSFHDEGSILVVDDDELSREMLVRRLRHSGYTVSASSTGLHALTLLRSQHFDLVLLDMIMPGLDGFQVLGRIKSDAALRDIPVIMLSALDEENGIARCIEMGAEDYLAKPFSAVFLRARIGACLEKKRLRDRERAMHRALQQSQEHLAGELARAAGYVRSLLPTPLAGPISTQWCFQPCDALGGDAFGHHWIDPQHLAIYLLDVCGHGVGAALLSVSALNTLRAQTLPGVDFKQPSAVLTALNRAFPMENQNFLYFTLWYGVYRTSDRQLIFANGGHPPALLVAPRDPDLPLVTPLKTPGPAVGCLDDASYAEKSQIVPPGSRLMVFSDGVFEIFKPDGTVGGWDEFIQSLHQPTILCMNPDERLELARRTGGDAPLADDFSFLELRFA